MLWSVWFRSSLGSLTPPPPSHGGGGGWLFLVVVNIVGDLVISVWIWMSLVKPKGYANCIWLCNRLADGFRNRFGIFWLRREHGIVYCCRDTV